MRIVRTVQELRREVSDWRSSGFTVGLVPTMGALHAGHFSLVDRATTETDRICVTLFVNPKQFGPNEDFEVYPRDEEADAGALQDRGADLLFAPGIDEMYPEGSATSVSVPGLGDILEGEFRPGFFTGVATVVSKLLIQSMPHRAYFGEKDYQQLCVIRRMSADLDLPVDIVGCPIIREPDGLALSSRNAYLSEEERAIAPRLQAALKYVAVVAGSKGDHADAARGAAAELVEAGFASVDYFTVRDASSLEQTDDPSANLRVLAAAWLGKTRLIDNVAVG